MLITVNTADGMLTKATPKIVPGKRARKITISPSMNKEIVVSVSPNLILTHKPEKTEITSVVLSTRTMRLGWHGTAWSVTNTETWETNQFHVLKHESILAWTEQEAIIEHLRYILNKELCIRAIVSDHVCQEVANVLNGKNNKSTFVGARNKKTE